MRPRDPLAWRGDRAGWMVRERRRVVIRSCIVGLIWAASLAWGIYGR